MTQRERNEISENLERYRQLVAEGRGHEQEAQNLLWLIANEPIQQQPNGE